MFYDIYVCYFLARVNLKTRASICTQYHVWYKMDTSINLNVNLQRLRLRLIKADREHVIIGYSTAISKSKGRLNPERTNV